MIEIFVWNTESFIMNVGEETVAEGFNVTENVKSLSLQYLRPDTGV